MIKNILFPFQPKNKHVIHFWPFKGPCRPQKGYFGLKRPHKFVYKYYYCSIWLCVISKGTPSVQPCVGLKNINWSIVDRLQALWAFTLLKRRRKGSQILLGIKWWYGRKTAFWLTVAIMPSKVACGSQKAQNRIQRSPNHFWGIVVINEHYIRSMW